MKIVTLIGEAFTLTYAFDFRNDLLYFSQHMHAPKAPHTPQENNKAVIARTLSQTFVRGEDNSVSWNPATYVAAMGERSVKPRGELKMFEPWKEPEGDSINTDWHRVGDESTNEEPQSHYRISRLPRNLELSFAKFRRLLGGRIRTSRRFQFQ